ncbi:metallophosphoesterase [Geoanaerobacter pelophilus]|uniref:metallophosphoesterase n=1 Tax=Geoanaerobacter pelophilus TaxID=60036 RepID=UPI000A268ADC|nr:metallophosphoesterase [Geoanaerobacter pelophilus]
MAIITTDIHGKPAVAKAFLSFRHTELHICLGDLVDSRKRPPCFEEEAECLDILLQSDSILLWGNHDLAYLPERPWKCFGNFGEIAFREQFDAARNRLLAAYSFDGWLCTHAGVSPRVERLLAKEVRTNDQEAVAAWLNTEFKREIRNRLPLHDPNELRYGHGPLFRIPVCRGGTDEFGGIFWFDALGEQTQPSPVVGRQIFGHTPVPYPERGTSMDFAGGPAVSWINLNAIEGHWVYDTQYDELTELTIF